MPLPVAVVRPVPPCETVSCPEKNASVTEPQPPSAPIALIVVGNWLVQGFDDPAYALRTPAELNKPSADRVPETVRLVVDAVTPLSVVNDDEAEEMKPPINTGVCVSWYATEVVECARPTEEKYASDVVLNARPSDEKYEADVVENPNPTEEKYSADVVENAPAGGFAAR